MAAVSISSGAYQCLPAFGLAGDDYGDTGLRGWDASSLLRVAGIPEGHQHAPSIFEDWAVGGGGEPGFTEREQSTGLTRSIWSQGRESRWPNTPRLISSPSSGASRLAGNLGSKSMSSTMRTGLQPSLDEHQSQGKDFNSMFNEALHELVRYLRNGSPRKWNCKSMPTKKGGSKARRSDSCSDTRQIRDKLIFAWNPASGPRKGNEGVEDLVQGLTGARCLGDGALQLHMTLLVAGFIIGPSGASIRDIIQKTGARISSWTQRQRRHEKRDIRVFVIKGTPVQMSHAVEIMLKAICRYKELAEGGYLGRLVDSAQVIEGVEFLYRPPPKDRVPYAASIDGIARKKLQRDCICFSAK